MLAIRLEQGHDHGHIHVHHDLDEHFQAVDNNAPEITVGCDAAQSLPGLFIPEGEGAQRPSLPGTGPAGHSASRDASGNMGQRGNRFPVCLVEVI